MKLIVGMIALGLAATGATAQAATQERPVTTATQKKSRIALADPDPKKDGGTNLGRLLAQATNMGPAVTQYTRVMVDGLAIPPLEREIMCLAVLHLERGEYEWFQHMKVAEMMGVPKAKVDAIANDRFGDPIFNDRERALLAFTRQVVKTVRVDDPTLKAVQAFYDPAPDRRIDPRHRHIYDAGARLRKSPELPLDATTSGASFWKSQEAGK